MALVEIQRALISVSNKSKLIALAQLLTDLKVDIMSTGGTSQYLQAHRIPVTDVSDLTGFPELLNGRVKTLHPVIHAGILAGQGDKTILAEHQIQPIDLVIANLYPFAKTVANPDCDLETAIEHIDIGGPTMLRAGAKNFNRVSVVCDIEDYLSLIAELQQYEGKTSIVFRRYLAAKVFAQLSDYDALIANYLKPKDGSHFPEVLKPSFKKYQELRYGENPQQRSALYHTVPKQKGTLVEARKLQGKELSFNNLIDADTALSCVKSLHDDQSACVIVKHATPCGAALADQQITAYEKAFACDPSSAFGGVIAFNQPLDYISAELILAQQFVEVIIAPFFDEDVQVLLASKPQLRVLCYQKEDLEHSNTFLYHSISGGVLLQECDSSVITANEVRLVTQVQPTQNELKDCLFAWHVAKYVKSNAIVCSKNQATLGIGGGQTSRVFSAEMAVLKARKAQLSLAGAVMASDAFFPFKDGIEVAIEAGVRAIIQPGGSIRDQEVIDCANEAKVAMLFTGMRHFRH